MYATMVTAKIQDNDKKPSGLGWLQIEKKTAQELQKLAVKSPTAMGTLLYMVNHMSRSNGLVVSQQAIADSIGAKRQTVNQAIKYLTTHNFIQIVKVGSSTVYVVNSRVAWQGKRGERFATFSADVVALENEQIDDIDSALPLKQVPKLMDGERVLIGNEDLPPPDQQEMNLP